MTAEEILGQRDKQVLEAVVIDYIRTGEPVGSRTVAKKYIPDISPATIRNVMADLEELNLLYRPHTSAGRVPTSLGWRYYIDSILTINELAKRDRERIKRAYEGSPKEIQTILRATSRILSELSKQAAVVLLPKLSQTIFKRIQFVRVNQKQVLTIFIAESGIVQSFLVEMDEDISQDELNKYSRYLSESLKGLSLLEVKKRILKEMEEERILFDRLLRKAIELSKKALQVGLDETDIVIEGQTNLLNYPEFADVGQMKKLLSTFEEKTKIIKLLDKCLSSEGVHIILGSEAEFKDVQNMSLISSTYSRGGDILGALGVIGPTRMDYSRIIPLVDYTAKLLSQIFEDE